MKRPVLNIEAEKTEVKITPHCRPKNLIGICEVKCSQSVISSLKYIKTLRTLNVLQINPIFISKEIVVYECYCKRKRLSALAKILFASLHFNSQLWGSLMETQCSSYHEEELLRGILCRYYGFSRFSSLHYDAWELQTCVCICIAVGFVKLGQFFTVCSIPRFPESQFDGSGFAFKEVLAEIPDQLLSTFMTKHDIKPKPRQPICNWQYKANHASFNQ